MRKNKLNAMIDRHEKVCPGIGYMNCFCPDAREIRGMLVNSLKREPTERDIDKVMETMDAEQDAKCSSCRDLRLGLRKLEARNTELVATVKQLARLLTLATIGEPR